MSHYYFKYVIVLPTLKYKYQAAFPFLYFIAFNMEKDISTLPIHPVDRSMQQHASQ